MTIQEFQNSLANLVIRKDALNADLTRLMQQLDAHANALTSYVEELSEENEEEATVE